jgi:hypothetical protein
VQHKHSEFLSDVLNRQRMGINPGENRGATAGGNRGATAGGNRGAQGEPHPVGTFFRKEFHSGTFVGRVMKITKNYKGAKLYLVAYSDGDDEELTASQLKILRTAHGLIQLKDAASWKSDYDKANPIGFVAFAAPFSVNMNDIADLEDDQQAHSYFTSPLNGNATVERVMLAKHKLEARHHHRAEASDAQGLSVTPQGIQHDDRAGSRGVLLSRIVNNVSCII